MKEKGYIENGISPGHCSVFQQMDAQILRDPSHRNPWGVTLEYLAGIVSGLGGPQLNPQTPAPHLGGVGEAALSPALGQLRAGVKQEGRAPAAEQLFPAL